MDTQNHTFGIKPLEQGILILSDGKPGHYNQSLGIMDRMGDVPVVVVEIRFRRKLRDNLLRIFARLLGGMRLSHKLIRNMLGWSMEGSAFKAVLSVGIPDIILSTGSSVAAPNLLLGQLINAKTVVCTRPSPIGINHFSLAILPEHMRPRRSAKNAVMTLGVPNRITPERVEVAGEKLRNQLGINKLHIVGLLLGGDDNHYTIPPEMASSLCDILLGLCEENELHLALTTSRRTDTEAEEAIKSKTRGNSICCFSILAGEPQQESPVPGILGISDIVIVTEDSFSMVCEAASSGKKVIILKVNRKKNGDPKRQRIYQILNERGYAKDADLSNLEDVILDLADNPSKPRVLSDAQTAADALCDFISRC